MRKILITVPSWTQNDAIGTDVMALHAQLTIAGWQVFVYTAAYDPAFASHVTKKISGLVSDPQAVLLYVNGWVWGEGEVLATAFAGRRVMRFHAGPSPHFFRPYDQVYLRMVRHLQFAGAMHCQHRLLRLALHWHETGSRPGDRFTNRFGVVLVIRLPRPIGLDHRHRHQSHVVAQLL